MSGLLGKSNIGGGGTGKAFAAISVTYPVGSVCTCSNGQKTLKAKDTSGSFLFLVPSGGEWTVTATDGEKSSSKTITVEEKGPYSISLAYELYIIQNGQPLYEMDVRRGTQYAVHDEFITMGTGEQGQPIGAQTKELIDCSAFSYLCALGCYWADRSYTTGNVALFDNQNNVVARTVLPTTPYQYTPVFSDIVRVPITDSHFKLGAVVDSNNWSGMWIKDLWLE